MTGRQIDMMNQPILKQYIWASLGLEWKIKTISLCRSPTRHICKHYSSSCSLNCFLPAAKGVFIYNTLPTLKVQLRHILTRSPGFFFFFFNKIDPQVPRLVAFTLMHVVLLHFFSCDFLLPAEVSCNHFPNHLFYLHISSNLSFVVLWFE